MKERKAPGENGIPTEAFCMLDDDNLHFSFTQLLRYWDDPTVDPPEWHI